MRVFGLPNRPFWPDPSPELYESSNQNPALTKGFQGERELLVYDHYCMVNSMPHPKTGEYLLHYVDRVRMRETIEYPLPVAFVIEFDHFRDEFRMYEGSKFPRRSDGTEINPASFVYQAIS